MSVIRQKDVCVSWGEKCSFFGKFDVLCFLEAPVLRFALLPYYRRIQYFQNLSHTTKNLLLFTVVKLWTPPLLMSFKIVWLLHKCLESMTLAATKLQMTFYNNFILSLYRLQEKQPESQKRNSSGLRTQLFIS